MNNPEQPGIDGALIDQDRNFPAMWQSLGWVALFLVAQIIAGVIAITIAAAIDLLEGQGERVVPALITIDPDRDTPAALADYVSRFHPRMIGLTGTAEQVAAAARAYRVFYAKVQRPEMTQYLMDHSSFIYLVGPDARVRALFRPETAPEAIAQAIRGQLRGG